MITRGQPQSLGEAQSIGVANYLDRATFLIAKKQFDAAGRMLREALASEPGAISVHYAYARCLLKAGRWTAARQVADTLLELAPDDVKSLGLMATIILNSRHDATMTEAVTILDEAEAVLSRAVKLDANYAYVKNLIREIRSMRIFMELDRAYRASNRSETPPKPSAGVSSSDLSAYLAWRIRQAKRHDDPFGHCVVSEIFPEDIYRQLLANRPPFELAESVMSKSFYADRRHFPLDHIAAVNPAMAKFWSQIYAAIKSQSVLQAFLDVFEGERFLAIMKNHGVAAIPDVRLLCDVAGFNLGPHKDHYTRLGSIVFNLADSRTPADIGTAIYRRNDGRVYFDNGLHRPFGVYSRHSRVSFVANSALVFLNLGDAYHAVEAIDRPLHRWTLQYSVRIS